MAWFLRAIEQPEGDWACAHGRTVFDRHTDRSPAPALPYHYAGLASVAGALVTTLGHNRVDVSGFSWGGGLAQQFAVNPSPPMSTPRPRDPWCERCHIGYPTEKELPTEEQR
ncbi:MAG: hypothetical protein QOH17_2868 [Pseudonocardiales bacterium]|nr:hypothetical protein [Pseudonocardiales bacterium]